MKQTWLKHGVLLGFVFFLAVFLVKPIGVSTQFSITSGIVHNQISNVIQVNEERSSGYESSNAYYDSNNGKMAENISNPITYDYIFVLAIPFGAFLAYTLFGKKKTKGKSVKQPLITYIPIFLGSFLLLFGARLADGCTSGHMMSGIMQGSISGFIFALVAFAIAIPTALLVGKKRG